MLVDSEIKSSREYYTSKTLYSEVKKKKQKKKKKQQRIMYPLKRCESKFLEKIPAHTEPSTKAMNSLEQ